MIIEQIENVVNDYESIEQNEKPGDIVDYAYVGSHIGVRLRIGGNLLFISSVGASKQQQNCISSRSEITEFTRDSGRRMRKYLRECSSNYRVIITLTYPAGYGYDGGKAKRDLKCFMQRYKRLHQKIQGVSAFWFMEFQKRGAIHFHIFGTDLIDKAVLSTIWYEICGTEDPRHLAAGTNVQAIRSGREGICAYASKYAAKHVQKVVPKEFGWVGRFWGVFGCRDVVCADTFVSAHSSYIPSLKRRLRELQNLMDDEVFKGNARMLPRTRENVMCYSLGNDWDLCRAVKIKLFLMQSIIALYDPQAWRYQNPELTDGEMQW